MLLSMFHLRIPWASPSASELGCATLIQQKKSYWLRLDKAECKQALISEHKSLGCPLQKYRDYSHSDIIAAAKRRLSGNDIDDLPPSRRSLAEEPKPWFQIAVSNSQSQATSYKSGNPYA